MKFLIFCTFLSLSASVAVASDSALASTSNLKSRMDLAVKRSGLPAASLGLAVYELGHSPETLLYGSSENKEFIPASVTKLATAATVLTRLGPTFKFKTQLGTTASLVKGILQGDLYLKGGGDAGFVSESMWFLVNELTRAGVTKVQGNLIVDDTDFDRIREDPSRDPERNDRAYDAPVGAMSFNWNSINIYVRPSALGAPAQVVLDPIDNAYKIVNKSKTTSGSGWTIGVSRSGNTVRVTGKIGIGHAEQAVYKNIDDPIEWSGRALQEFLKQRGILVSGKIRAGQMPKGAKILATAESKALAEHVRDMMKFSNNFVAEMLTKDLAAENGTRPATLEDGMKLVQNQVASMGLDPKEFTLQNPSGLSRHNRIRPSGLARILIESHKSFPWFAEFLTALPIAGLDGTLKKRMKNGPAEGWVRAKTGQLTGVAALAGYAGRKDGSTLAFAFIFNGQSDKGENARHLFDALAVELVQ